MAFHLFSLAYGNGQYVAVGVWSGPDPLFIDPAVFQRVQDIFAGYNRPKHRRRKFAFGGGLLRCGYDDCLITAEIKKQRYVHDETVRNGKVIDTTYKHAYFCTRCGAKVRDA